MRRLTADQVECIQAATEQVLETVGVRVMHAGLLARARAAGAEVEDASGVVRISAPLLRELLARVPAQYDIAGVPGADESARSFTVGGDHPGCLAIVTDPWIIDYQTQRPRRPCLEDVRRHTIVAQKLSPVVAVYRMNYPVTDYAGAASDLHALEAHLLNHDKHIYVLPTSMADLEQWLEIGRILTQGRTLSLSKLITVGIPIVSPLTLTEVNAQQLLFACDQGLSVRSTICPMAGTTAPYSKIGALVLGNAENLFLAALTQVVRPGHPYLYASGTSVTDMASGEDLYYTMDKVLWKMASAQLGRSYGLPVTSECGGTMTYRYDQQNGAEGMLFMLAALTAHSHMLAGIGSCHNANGMSAEMMVVQTSWLRAARFLDRGIDVGMLDAALESIRRVGPGGHYLTDDMTLERLRSGEFFADGLFDHTGTYGPYPSMLERAHETVERMVADFESPLPGEVQEGLRRYFHDRYRRTAA